MSIENILSKEKILSREKIMLREILYYINKNILNFDKIGITIMSSINPEDELSNPAPEGPYFITYVRRNEVTNIFGEKIPAE